MNGASPYVLPDGNVQISFSGGRTSAYLLHHILEANGGLSDRAKVIFTNTGREMPETLDFVAEVGHRWGVPIIWLEYRRGKPGFEEVGHNQASRNGEPFDALIDAKQYLPNVTQRFCTQDLKIRPAKRYLIANGWLRWTAALGIRADEPNRVKTEKQKERWQRWYPLNDAGVTKHHVAAFWNRQPFDLRLPNIKGNCPLGNCDGCFLKSQAAKAALVRDMPERAAWWEAAERRVGAMETQKGRPKDNEQFDKRESWSELRSFIERQGDMAFSTEGMLCQADGGECLT